MSECDLSSIDTTVWKPIQSPGLRSPRQQVSYDSYEVQKVLSDSFGVMFPSIIQEDGGNKRYVAMNAQGVDVMALASPVKNINDIPKAEMMRLMEGWIRLRRKLQEGEVAKGVGAIILNFRVPNPRQSLDRYLLFKEGGEQRLIIRWGYEAKDKTAVSLERAISILMDVPLGHMQSILSTSMSPTTSTVAVGQIGDLEGSPNSRQSYVSRQRSVVFLLVAMLAVLPLGALAYYVLVMNKAGGSASEQVVKVARQEGEASFLRSDPLIFHRDESESLEGNAVAAVALQTSLDPREDIAYLEDVDRLLSDEKPEVNSVMAGEGDASIARDSNQEVSLEAMAGGARDEDESLSLDEMMPSSSVEDKTDLLSEMLQ